MHGPVGTTCRQRLRKYSSRPQKKTVHITAAHLAEAVLCVEQGMQIVSCSIQRTLGSSIIRPPLFFDANPPPRNQARPACSSRSPCQLCYCRLCRRCYSRHNLAQRLPSTTIFQSATVKDVQGGNAGFAPFHKMHFMPLSKTRVFGAAVPRQATGNKGANATRGYGSRQLSYPTAGSFRRWRSRQLCGVR